MFLSCFYRKQTSLQVKTADHKKIDSRLVETRRLMMLETSSWCHPVPELPTSWSCLALWTPHYLKYLFIHRIGCDGSYGMWDLHYIMWDLSVGHMVSLVVSCGLSNCGQQAYFLWGMWDLSSRTRDQTQVPCIASQTLCHWVTRPIPTPSILISIFPMNT